MLTITDLFCGAGGSSSGAIQVPGVRVRMAANHWKLAVETHNTNHPTADHDCADISQVDPRRYPTTDILWASPECFTAGHLVTTARGQVPIEEVQVGDLALTHLGRWRPVVRVQSRHRSTVVATGQGHTGIEVTPNHRFWSRTSRQVWDNSIRQYRRKYQEADWLPIEDAPAAEALWSTPVRIAPLPIPDVPAVFGLDLTAAWWLVGRWVGDGSLTFGRNHEVLLACGFHEAAELRERLADTAFAWAESAKRTAAVFSIGNEKARDWLHHHFEHGAANKGLPSFVYAMPRAHRQALLDGYLSADGGTTQRRVRVSTVSRRLAVSVRMLAESLGHRVAMAHDKRTTYTIEGRTGVAQVQWILHWEPTLSPKRAPEAFADALHAWSRVRRVAPGRDDVEVFNIEVEEDHSYVLDGIVVANCTNHSQAKGKRRADRQPDLFGEVLPDEAAERSRATMWDVCRFVEAMKLRGHPYKAFVVENVVDVRQWMFFDAWAMALRSAGYCLHFVYLNSMFAQGAGAPAPQSRDRWYCVGHLSGNRCPDLRKWTSPAAWCPRCEVQVKALQVWKNPDRPAGRYRQQYVYLCPSPRCGEEVFPGVLPAAVAIDWALPGERIGDRVKPLAPKTIARIEAGLRRYAQPTTPPFIALLRTNAMTHGVDEPLNTVSAGGGHHGLVDPMLVPAGGTWNDSAVSVAEPFRTRTTRENDALVVPVEGREGLSARPASDPARTQTARLQDALVVPLRNNNTAKPVTQEPLDTVAAAGNHHALVMRNNSSKGDGAEMSTPVDEPIRTITTTGHQSLIRWGHMLVPYYGTRAVPSLVGDPMGTVTTLDRRALVGPEVAVDDCTFRMLEPHEIQAAMAFLPAYEVLGNKREKVRQLGNAVTPPAARDLIAAVVESITGEPIDLGRAA